MAQKHNFKELEKKGNLPEQLLKIQTYEDWTLRYRVREDGVCLVFQKHSTDNIRSARTSVGTLNAEEELLQHILQDVLGNEKLADFMRSHTEYQCMVFDMNRELVYLFETGKKYFFMVTIMAYGKVKKEETGFDRVTVNYGTLHAVLRPDGRVTSAKGFPYAHIETENEMRERRRQRKNIAAAHY